MADVTSHQGFGASMAPENNGEKQQMRKAGKAGRGRYKETGSVQSDARDAGEGQLVKLICVLRTVPGGEWKTLKQGTDRRGHAGGYHLWGEGRHFQLSTCKGKRLSAQTPGVRIARRKGEREIAVKVHDQTRENNGRERKEGRKRHYYTEKGDPRVTLAEARGRQRA